MTSDLRAGALHGTVGAVGGSIVGRGPIVGGTIRRSCGRGCNCSCPPATRMCNGRRFLCTASVRKSDDAGEGVAVVDGVENVDARGSSGPRCISRRSTCLRARWVKGS